MLVDIVCYMDIDIENSHGPIMNTQSTCLAFVPLLSPSVKSITYYPVVNATNRALNSFSTVFNKAFRTYRVTLPSTSHEVRKNGVKIPLSVPPPVANFILRTARLLHEQPSKLYTILSLYKVAESYGLQEEEAAITALIIAAHPAVDSIKICASDLYLATIKRKEIYKVVAHPYVSFPLTPQNITNAINVLKRELCPTPPPGDYVSLARGIDSYVSSDTYEKYIKDESEKIDIRSLIKSVNSLLGREV
jgi:hypothetical protein